MAGFHRSPTILRLPSTLHGLALPRRTLTPSCSFNEFYELISHNFALIPALASDAYYDRKFSSTLITSLVTSTPVIVDWRFIQVGP